MVTNLIESIWDVKKSFERENLIDTIYIDFEKAFDQVLFAIMNVLLEAHGIHPIGSL